MDCPFCDIVVHHTERIIKMGQDVFVILSNPRLMPGHMLVIPKRHVEKLADLTDIERQELMETAISFQEKILKNVASGCDLTTHYRPFIQQGRLKVNHLHVHLRPREHEDHLYQKVQKFEKEVFEELPAEEIEKFRKLLSD